MSDVSKLTVVTIDSLN